jgi:hypothetical protein
MREGGIGNTPGDRLDVLVVLVEAWEAKRCRDHRAALADIYRLSAPRTSAPSAKSILPACKSLCRGFQQIGQASQ